jgi:hypothetical protein
VLSDMTYIWYIFLQNVYIVAKNRFSSGVTLSVFEDRKYFL